MATENILVCCFSATLGLNVDRPLNVWTPVINYQSHLQLPKTSIYVLAFRYSGITCKHIRLKSGLVTLLWWLKTQFFESKLAAENISCFEMTNVQALDTLTIYSNISKRRLLIQINSLQKRQNRNGYIKEESFVGRETLKLFSIKPRKFYQYVKCWSPPSFCTLPCFHFSYGSWR